MVIGTTLHGMRAAGEFLRSGSFDPLRNFPAGATIKLAAKDMPIGGAASPIYPPVPVHSERVAARRDPPADRPGRRRHRRRL